MMILKIEQGGCVQLEEVRGVTLGVVKDELHVWSDSEQVDRLGPRWRFPATDEVAVYLMNDRGKTVDCLWPRPQEIDSDYEVVLEDGEAVLQPKGEKAEQIRDGFEEAVKNGLLQKLKEHLSYTKIRPYLSESEICRLRIRGNVEPIGFNTGHVRTETT
jgi:hypothetical protein